MEPMIAYCGLNCATCDARIATQAGDREAQEQVLAKWRVEYNFPEMTIDWATCDGCLTVGGRLSTHCGQCNIRACALEKGVATCGHCADYACDKVAGLLDAVPEARAALETIRHELGAA